MDVIEAIRKRTSIRAFLDKPVDPATVRAILEAARFAPSGVNTQPWQVAVVEGSTKQKISETIIAERAQGVKEHPDYHYYPLEWFEPYKSRRFACGMALYGALGIERNDIPRRQEVWNLNYHFFGAPIGLLFFVDRRLEKGSWMDCAMFIQNVMLAARGYGLETCPQASLADYPSIIRRILNFSDELALICGVALGYADHQHPINNYRTSREEVDNFTKWYD